MLYINGTFGNEEPTNITGLINPSILPFVGDNCPPPPDLKNIVPPEVESLAFNTYLNITCRRGYWFADENDTVTIWCNETGGWEPELEDCIRTYIDNFYIPHTYTLPITHIKMTLCPFF